MLAEPDAFEDVATGMVADGQVGRLVGGSDAAIEGAGTFGGLGGVLGHVRSDLAVAEFPVVVIGQMSGSRPQAMVRAGTPGAAGVSRWTVRAACSMAAVSRARVAQGGGAAVGPPGPSRRMMAWKWTTPRRWYSAHTEEE